MASNNSAVIPQNDLDLMLNQTENEINTMIGGMLSLIESNRELNAGLQSQSWCQRMLNTIIGKNRATADEIRQNHDQLNAYIAQAVSILFNQNKISLQIMVSLGLKISEIYNSHLELKKALGNLAQGLHNYIESVDNYNTLLHSIEHRIYGTKPNLSAVIYIISQLDSRILNNKDQLILLKKAMIDTKILPVKKNIAIRDILTQISNLNDEKLGVVYTDLQLYRHNLKTVDLAVATIESWNMLSSTNKSLINRPSLIDNILKQAEIDSYAKINCGELFDDLIELRKELNSGACSVQIYEDETMLDTLTTYESDSELQEEYDYEIDENGEDQESEDVEDTEFVQALRECVERFWLDCKDPAITTYANYNLSNSLKIEDNEEVLLAYDNTITKNGKEGFAITNFGINFNSNVLGNSFISWDDITNETIKKGFMCVKVGGNEMLTYTGAYMGVLNNLVSLVNELASIARIYKSMGKLEY